MALALAHPQQTVVQLAAGEVWSIDPAEPATVLWCVAGRCWATQTGDYVDHYLQAGEALPLQPRGRVVVQALVPTSIFVQAMRRAASAA